MEIIHVAAELTPIAKVGGLGDVLQGLSHALLKKKQGVKIILPKYDTLDLSGVENLRIIETHLPVRFGGSTCTNTLWECVTEGIQVILVESNDQKEFFDRGTVYGCSDDINRFTYFCLAALEYLRRTPCDVIHLHDWHTALIAPLLKEVYHDIKASSVLTLHNLAYQGICSRSDLEKVGWHNEHLKDGDHYNLLKGGILFSDRVTTVSPNYAKEILTTEMAGGLKTTLKNNQHKFSGILNGIDYAYWNPETDPFLTHHYSSESLSNKEEIKRELKSRVGLSDEKCPLVVAITRLVPQKGPDLIKAALLRTLEWGGQFILLGSALDEKTHTQFYNLKRTLAGSDYVHMELSYNEKLAHMVYAAADLFLVPSLFEPCGLTQQIAMRYGTVPLVRETGGLVDTVFEGENGFTFGPPTAESLCDVLDRALETYYDKPDIWDKLVQTGIRGDYSWDKPAEEYLNIYDSCSPFSTSKRIT